MAITILVDPITNKPFSVGGKVVLPPTVDGYISTNNKLILSNGNMVWYESHEYEPPIPTPGQEEKLQVNYVYGANQSGNKLVLS